MGVLRELDGGVVYVGECGDGDGGDERPGDEL